MTPKTACGHALDFSPMMGPRPEETRCQPGKGASAQPCLRGVRECPAPGAVTCLPFLVRSLAGSDLGNSPPGELLPRCSCQSRVVRWPKPGPSELSSRIWEPRQHSCYAIPSASYLVSFQNILSLLMPVGMSVANSGGSLTDLEKPPEASPVEPQTRSPPLPNCHCYLSSFRKTQRAPPKASQPGPLCQK